MKQENIRVGMILKLKKQRQEAYGMESGRVEVTAIKANPPYVVPWIMSGTDAYKPQDFAECITWVGARVEA